MVCKGSVCGIDTETELIQNSYTTPPLVLYGCCSGRECELVEWQDFDKYLPEFLSKNPETKFAFFNGPFDQYVMGEDIWIPELNKDNRVMELQCAYPQHKIATVGHFVPGFTLEFITKELLGVKLDKDESVRLAFKRGVPITDKQYEYMCFDAISTCKLGELLQGQRCESIQARGAFVLSTISRNGMLVDRPYLQKQIDKWKVVLDESAAKLKSFGYPVKEFWNDFKSYDFAKRVCTNIGIAEEDFVKIIPKDTSLSCAWWRAMACVLYGAVANKSSISEIRADVRDLLVLPFTDVAPKDKKAFDQGIFESLKSMLEPIDCLPCLVGLDGGKKPIAQKPWQLLALLASEKIAKGDPKHNYMRDEVFKELGEEFHELHERNMGWLTGSKPISQKDFLQNHVKEIVRQYPKIDLELTDSSKKAVNARKLEEAKLAKKEKREQQRLDLSDIIVYQVTGKEKWRFTDQGINDPFLETYWTFKHAEKMLKTYLTDKYIQGDRRVHSRFTSYLKTGRTGSSSPNIQNLPKEHGLREQYIPADGNVLVSIDFSQQELCAIAQHCKLAFGHSRMYDLINHGLDLHSTFAAHRDGALKAFNLSCLSEDNVVKIKKIIEAYKTEPELTKRRAAAKASNFGLGGGMQARTFYITLRNAGIEITMEGVEQLIKDWYDFYPEVIQMQQLQQDGEIKASVFDGGAKQEEEDDDDVEENFEIEDVHTIQRDADGNPIEDPDRMVKLYRVTNALGMVKARGTKCAVTNFIFQSYAATANKIMLWWVFYSEWLRSKRLGVPPRFKIVCYIHDEIIIEVVLKFVNEVTKEVGDLMVASVKSVMPGVLIKTEAEAMTRWSKDAKSLYDEAGNIIVNKLD